MKFSRLNLAILITLALLAQSARAFQSIDPDDRPTETGAFFERTHGALEVALEKLQGLA